MELGITTGGGSGSIIKKYTAGDDIQMGIFCGIGTDGKAHDMINMTEYHHNTDINVGNNGRYLITAVLSKTLGVIIYTLSSNAKASAFSIDVHNSIMNFGTALNVSSYSDILRPYRYSDNSFIACSTGKLIYGVVNNDLSITLTDYSDTSMANYYSDKTKILVLNDGFFVVLSQDKTNSYYITKWTFTINNGAIEQVGVKEVLVSASTQEPISVREYINGDGKDFIYFGGQRKIVQQEYLGNGTFGASNTYDYNNYSREQIGCNAIIIDPTRTKIVIPALCNIGGYVEKYRFWGDFNDTTGAMSNFKSENIRESEPLYDGSDYIYVNDETYLGYRDIYKVEADNTGALIKTSILASGTTSGNYTTIEGYSIYKAGMTKLFSIGCSYTDRNNKYAGIRLNAENETTTPFCLSLEDIPNNSQGKFCLSGECKTTDEIQGLKLGKSYDKNFAETTTAEHKRITKIDAKTYFITPYWALDDNN